MGHFVTNLELPQHVISVDLDTAHIELHRPDVFIHPPTLVQIRRHFQLFGHLPRGAILLIFDLELFQYIQLVAKERLHIVRLNLDLVSI
jgi:hypothetical protein